MNKLSLFRWTMLFTILFTILAALLSACGGGGTEITATPTPTAEQNIVGAVNNLALQNLQYQMTKDAAQAQQESLSIQMTSTAMVKADMATRQAEAKSDKATQQARADMLTQQAVVAAYTQQAWSVTVTAGIVATQTAFPMTQTAMPMYATAEAASLSAKVRQENGSADLVELTVDRQRKKNSLDAYLPWTLIVSAFVVGALCIVVYGQWRQLKRDRNGMIGVEAVKHKNGVTYVKPDLMTGAAMTISKAGNVVEAGSESDFQKDTTRRQQLIEASKGKSLPEFKQVVGMFGQTATNTGNINYFDADRFFGSVLKDAEDDMIDGEVSDVK